MSDWEVQKQRISNYYSKLLSTHGTGFRACDYGHPGSQMVKFRVLSEVVPIDGKSVLDVGCGFGDFLDFLNASGAKVDYVGVDIGDQIVGAAQEAHPDARIHRLDILSEEIGRTFDVVTASGIFYLLQGNEWQIMRRLIGRMFELSTCAVAFNSLGDWCDDQQDGEFYASPYDVLDFCRSLTPWVSFRNDYHPRDFSVYMYRQPYSDRFN